MSANATEPGEGGDRRRGMVRMVGAALRCSSCRRFDGLAWCHGWNVPTGPEEFICQMYRARRQPKPPDPA